ncbi:MAG: hypothetical protein R3199_09295, partial [Gemmatimonadota bacterium]|nr:hypothetical protein [Gemmatimonadota bacterium]
MRGFRAPGAFLLCAAFTVGACSGDVGEWAAEHGFDPAEVHEVRIGANGFPFVPVAIDGDTVELMFDTGNMVGVSLTAEKLEELDLPRIGEWTRLASDRSVVGRYGVHRAESVSVFGVELPSRVYEWSHPRLPGLVGPRFLRGRRFTLDYDAGVLGMSEEPADPADRPPGGVPLVRSERHPDLLLVHGRVGGRRVLMELDTGKSRTVIDPG